MNSGQLPPSSTPSYLEKYALACAPFEHQTDRKCFYGGTALMQRLDLLAHLTQFGDPLALVMGPSGSGKSTMLGQFVERANKRWYLCRLNRDSLHQLPAHLSTALGGADVNAGMDSLLDRWDTETDASRLFVIVIDDADQLDAEACRMLCELLDKPQGERIRVILFGTSAIQPLVKETLGKLASARSPQILEVPRLSEEETAAYLMYRLAVAGYSGESPFSSIEIRAICKAADGWPGAINQYAHETLTEQMIRTRGKRQLPTKNALGNRKSLWLAVPAILLISIIYFGWQNLYSPALDDVEPEAQNLPLALPKPQQAEDTEPTGPAPSRSTVAVDLTGTTQKPAIDMQREVPAPIAAQSPEHQQALTDAIPLPLPDHQGTPPTDADQAADTTEPKSVAISTTPTASPVEKPQEPLDPAQPTSPELPAPATPTPAPTPTPTEPPARTTAQTAAGEPHREAWLLQQPVHYFSLQLLGSRSEKLLTDFIRQHKLDPAQTAYYRGLHKGSDWFVLMYGLYPTREAALEGLAALPGPVRKAKPWPRELQVVQQLVRDANP